MSEEKGELVKAGSTELSQPIDDLHKQLEGYLSHVGLPIENVVVPISERKKVIASLEDALSIIPADDRIKSHYLSKYTVAISVGLFDGALNYLWDETVRTTGGQSKVTLTPSRSANLTGENSNCFMKRITVMERAEASTTEEPDAGKLHVRVCGGGAG